MFRGRPSRPREELGVLLELRRVPSCPPVILLSMHAERVYADRAFAAGAAGYLGKQTASEELGKAVRAVLSGVWYVPANLAQSAAAGAGQSRSIVRKMLRRLMPPSVLALLG